LSRWRNNIPSSQEALITISGSVRNTATLLEVLVATKMARFSGLQPADARFAHRCLGAWFVGLKKLTRELSVRINLKKDAAQRAVLGLQV
jgi:hypothetical protein